MFEATVTSPLQFAVENPVGTLVLMIVMQLVLVVAKRLLPDFAPYIQALWDFVRQNKDVIPSPDEELGPIEWPDLDEVGRYLLSQLMELLKLRAVAKERQDSTLLDLYNNQVKELLERLRDRLTQ